VFGLDEDLLALTTEVPETLLDLGQEHHIAVGGYDLREDKRVINSIETSLDFLRLFKKSRSLFQTTFQNSTLSPPSQRSRKRDSSEESDFIRAFWQRKRLQCGELGMSGGDRGPRRTTCLNRDVTG
jgi:hypothetical protein